MFRAAGEDSWVAIAACSEPERRALCERIERADLFERREDRAALDAAICDWVRARAASAVEAELQAAGIAAHVVLDMPGLFDIYKRAVESSGKTLWIWKLAYNEQNLDGWVAAGKTAFTPAGSVLNSQFESANQYDYQFLALDTVTSGDFSLEAKVLVEKGEVELQTGNQRVQMDAGDCIEIEGKRIEARRNRTEAVSLILIVSRPGNLDLHVGPLQPSTPVFVRRRSL